MRRASRASWRPNVFSTPVSWPSKCTVPRVGSYRPTSSRATVLLPQPDSPTSASVLPFSMAKLTPSTACTNCRALRSMTRFNHGADTSKVLARSCTCDQRRHAAAPCTNQQAARVWRALRSSGRSRRQRSITCGQRGLKAQPCGNRIQPRHRTVDLQQPLARVVHRRDRAHQPGGVGVRRMVDHLVHRPDLADAPGVHHGHPVAGFGDHAHVVGDQHHGRAMVLAQPLEQRNDLRLDRHVQRGGRFVGDDQFGLGGQRQRDHHALAHAAGKLVRVLFEPLFGRRDAGFLQQRIGTRARLFGADRQVRAGWFR